MSKVTVIVPAYNPDSKFVKLVSELVEEFDVLAVNDGSADKCRPFFDEALKYGITLIEHEKNKGKGAALKTAIAHMMASGEEWVAVTADADGQHCLKDIREVARLAKENPHHLILGVRNFKGMPARSRFGNSFTRISFMLATQSRVSDTQTGLRGFTHETADRLITADGDRYEYEMNVLINLRRWGIPVKETVIETIYIDDNASSHFHPIRDSLIVFGQLIKHIGASLVCTAVDFLLYYVLLAWAPIPPALSYILAKGSSAVLNHQLSARFVFRTKPTLRSTVLFFALVLVNIGIGALLMLWFTHMSSTAEWWVKLPIELVLFMANYLVQKHFVFNEKKKKKKQ